MINNQLGAYYLKLIVLKPVKNSFRCKGIYRRLQSIGNIKVDSDFFDLNESGRILKTYASYVTCKIWSSCNDFGIYLIIILNTLYSYTLYKCIA